MDDVESIAHELASAFADNLRQAGSIRAFFTDSCLRSQTYDHAGKPGRITREYGWPPGLQGLMNRLRSGNGTSKFLAVDVAVADTREYTVTYSEDLPSLPTKVVFDGGYRYPNHPAPGMPKPAAAVNDGHPTDPAILADVQALIAEFVELHTRLRGEPPKFLPGSTETDIFAAEERIGVRLPEDLRAYYRTIRYDTESGLFGRFCPVPLEGIIAMYEDDYTSYGRQEQLFDDPVVFEPHPHGHVRRLSRNDWWVTFAPDNGGNFAAVDLDPGPGGTYGQILAYGHGYLIDHVAPALRNLMASVVAFMREADPSLDGWDDAWPLSDWTPVDHEWRISIGDTDLATHVATVADPSLIQMAHLRQANEVHLADAAPLVNLRSIRIGYPQQPAGYVDLAIPVGLPVEEVYVMAERFEPRHLATTPTIIYMTLGENTEPVSIARLADLQNLARLDLAEAVVADITAIADLPALRVLTLNARQWNDLLASGWTPGRLAAAKISGSATVAESAAWLSTIRGADHPTVRHRTIRGQL